MPMSEIDYFEMQENAAIGQVIAACATAIFNSHDCETMGQLQRNMYKYTDAGIAISFELHDTGIEPDSVEAHIGGCESPRKSRFVYCGDERAYKIKEPWNWIRKIGVSSIVEGSDAEVPLEWIDLLQYADDDKYDGNPDDLAKIAVKDFDELCDAVDKEACDLWHEANALID